MPKQFWICIMAGAIFGLGAQAQVVPPNAAASGVTSDSVKTIQLIKAGSLVGAKKDSVNVQKLIGEVMLRQENVLFTCDSAFLNKLNNSLEAFGKIHINQADSVHTYSNYLYYDGNTKKAILKKNVRLTDQKMVLTTDNLDYDLNTKIGTYVNGGKLVNGQTVLTSEQGYYYGDTKDVYFKKKVLLIDPQYTLATDTLLYNAQTEIATFVAPTTIHDGKSTIYTTNGFYDTRNGMASFSKRAVLKDSTKTITADDFFWDKKTGLQTARGNVVFTDTAQKISILANYAESNDKTGIIKATQKPLLILQREKDTIYVAADTLYSGIENNKKIPIASKDSLPPRNETSNGLARSSSDPTTQAARDSTAQRYIQAFYHVRIFSDSLQGVADSLFYSSIDSAFRLFRNPVLWVNNNQLGGDTIWLYTKNQQADKIWLHQNAMIINEAGPRMYNQIKGNNVYGYFKEARLDWMHVNGNAESVYYAKDDEGAYIGVNKAEAAIIDIYFKNDKLNRVVFRQDAKSITYPILQADPAAVILRNFKWLEDLRPKSKFELMQ